MDDFGGGECGRLFVVVTIANAPGAGLIRTEPLAPVNV